MLQCVNEIKVCEALWSNCKWTQLIASKFFLCKNLWTAASLAAQKLYWYWVRLYFFNVWQVVRSPHATSNLYDHSIGGLYIAHGAFQKVSNMSDHIPVPHVDHIMTTYRPPLPTTYLSNSSTWCNYYHQNGEVDTKQWSDWHISLRNAPVKNMCPKTNGDQQSINHYTNYNKLNCAKTQKRKQEFSKSPETYLKQNFTQR